MSLIRKMQTLSEAHADVTTSDGYLVRMFVIAFTKKHPGQVKSSCFAHSAQIRRIRKKMVDIMVNEASKVQVRKIVKKLIPESIGKEIEKHTQGIYTQVFIRKVKILRKPKLDITKLMELHTDTGDYDAGAVIGRPEDEGAQNLLTAAMVVVGENSMVVL